MVFQYLSSFEETIIPEEVEYAQYV